MRRSIVTRLGVIVWELAAAAVPCDWPRATEPAGRPATGEAAGGGHDERLAIGASWAGVIPE